jgi:hypothetical protein
MLSFSLIFFFNLKKKKILSILPHVNTSLLITITVSPIVRSHQKIQRAN